MEILVTALEQGITPAIIVTIYLIISDIIRTKRESKQIKINNDTIEAIVDIKTIIKDIYNKNEIENKEKTKIAINNTFDSAAFDLINFVQRTLISNHLNDSKTAILANIHNAANSEYYIIFQTLSLYSVDGKRVSEYIDKQLLKEIETDLLDFIYNETLNNEDKLMGYINKITLRFRTYINYLQNKVLK